MFVKGKENVYDLVLNWGLCSN